MGEKGWPQSRFLAVNAIIMNPDHRARDRFEEEAVEALKRGQDRYEKVEGNRFRAATVVSLSGGCFSCHWAPAGQSSRAAISWSIPLRSR
jgi:hypothetical protein